ncbi:Glycosyl transferase, family 2 [Arcticibacter svalbardensis MN12-7]|uniref:Glycosyl transferase, family 2 n=1 Tax=Arcticibacter svalbardensis MN12-7 TaxID=1150600 RepID=R9GTF6_9SPHI|nr:glycosyltransferase family 2 protein [Arcticibacter svalbardensis]EOR94978.1 Glycosyl transferase, family 2 [Arcticibacter svalbardensis MN12-7]
MKIDHMESKSTTNVFVIIVTYNGTKWVEKCFDSLKNSLLPLQIIVVDNQSTDNTVALICSDYPDVKVIQSQVNLGFGKANNIGIREALIQGADYVFLLNQDAWILPDTVAILVAAHKKQQEYFVLSPVHLDGTGEKLDLGFSTYISPYNCESMISDLILRKEPSEDIYTITFVNAAFWLISRHGIEQAGVFDPIFPHYGEDDDYMHRVIYHGGKTGVCPNSYGCHDRIQELANVKKMPYEKRYKRQIVGCLITLMNINRSFYHCFMVFLRSRMEFFFSAFFKLKIKESYLEMKVFVHILFMIGKIKRHRLKNRQKESWLNH